MTEGRIHCYRAAARCRRDQARGLSSAGSAANAVVDAVRSLTEETPGSDWHSVAVCSDGSYDVDAGLISSFLVRTKGGKWEIVQNVLINDFSRSKIDASVAELQEERGWWRIDQLGTDWTAAPSSAATLG